MFMGLSKAWALTSDVEPYGAFLSNIKLVPKQSGCVSCRLLCSGQRCPVDDITFISVVLLKTGEKLGCLAR